MYKMIVVDDEYLVRTGITETIDWNKYDIEIVDTAQNGKVGLEKIELHHPDIIISDIKMPVMNGLQLVEALYERNYDGIIIMLSGYNDFEYAKGTLERGVFKYLLKPIDNDELIDIVVKAREKLKKRRVMDMYISDIHVSIPIIKNKLADDVFHGVSDGEIKQKFALYDMPLLEKGIVIYCKADVSTAGNESESEENVEKALSIIREEIVSLLSNHRMFYSTGQIRVAFATDFVDVDALEKKLTETLRNYEKLSNVVLSIGLSGQFGRFEDIHSAFGTAKFIASNKLYAINSVYIADQAKENLKMYKDTWWTQCSISRSTTATTS